MALLKIILTPTCGDSPSDFLTIREAVVNAVGERHLGGLISDPEKTKISRTALVNDGGVEIHIILDSDGIDGAAD